MRCPACGNENREGARFCDSCGAELVRESTEARIPEAVRALPDDAPADLGNGRYRVRSYLGQGVRKRVYLAEDVGSKREVAVALFDTAGAPTAVQTRARREAEAMRKLGDHPHVVRVYDTGEEGGNPFIVSEYMPGGDVQALLAAEGGRLGVARAVEIAADVTRALEHAHARGIIHRDIKPANVWLGEDGRARLGDFGLATTEGRSRVTARALVGTVAYLPPEQALGEASGPKSDLYSLGALLYEMLAGQPPFPGDDAVSIISQHLHADPVPPSRHNPEVPAALDRVVLDLLAKRAEDRPGSAAEVRGSLLPTLDEPAAGTEPAEAAENPLDSLAGGVFVGRERELDEMRRAVDAALAGHGRLQLVVGEPGIGKTRAAEVLSTYARVSGARVYWGRCREDEGAPAYWPWVQAIRSYVRDADPVALGWQLGAGASEVAQLVPQVAEHLQVEPASDTESEEARFRLFDSITSFLVSAARDRPMVIVLDDLHWADEPSLLLLKFAAREIGSGGLLLVGTYRDVELGRHHPLARVLGEIAAAEGASRLNLRGLSVEAVGRYIEMTAGVEPPGGLAEAVHAQTEGNPFFVGEVVRLLAGEGRLTGAGGAPWEAQIPQGVREVVGRRLDRLSGETNEALKVAAAVGREFDADVVWRVADLSEKELVSAAREAMAERLVTELGGSRYSFSHALVRDTLYDELSPPQRTRLHGRIAIAVEEICGDDHASRLGELAHHFLAAATPGGDVDKAIEYAERAGVQAMDQLAYEEAAELYERAVEVLELSERVNERRRCGLLLRLGAARTASGRFAGARRAFEGAAAAARSAGDVDSLVDAVLGMSALTEAGSVDQPLVELIDEALEAIGSEESARRANLLSAKAQEMYWVDARRRAEPLNREAVELARRVGDPAGLAAALHRQIFQPFGPRAPRERLAIADEMLELGDSCGDRETVVRSHAYRLQCFLELGDIGRVDRELAIYARLAEDLRMPQHIWHTYALRGMRALLDGNLEEAERLAEEARRRGERAEQPLASQYYGIQLIQIRRLQGRVGELLPAVRELAQRFPGIPAWRTALIGISAQAGNIEEGRMELERFAGDDFSAIPRDANWVPGMALLGEATALLGDRARAGALYDELLPYEGLVIVVARAAGSQGPLSRILGLLARVTGRPDDAERHLTDAIELATRMGDRPNLALARIDLGEVMMARGGRGDRDRALELLSEALGSARRMGARWLVDRGLALRLEAQGLAGVDVTTSIDDVVSALESERPDLRAHAAPDGTVAILFSDIEDSTLITERLGDERWLEVLRAHNALFRERLDRYRGYEVKSQGDGFMLAFPDPREALRCAVSVQRAFAERERDGIRMRGRPVGEAEERPEMRGRPVGEAEERPVSLRVRMGLHTGEVIAEEGDFFGKNVILAARIAGQARGGEILVSAEMRDSVEKEDGLTFDDGRELELKGLAGTHRVYRAEWEPQAAAAS